MKQFVYILAQLKFAFVIILAPFANVTYLQWSSSRCILGTAPPNQFANLENLPFFPQSHFHIDFFCISTETAPHMWCRRKTGHFWCAVSSRFLALVTGEYLFLQSPHLVWKKVVYHDCFISWAEVRDFLGKIAKGVCGIVRSSSFVIISRHLLLGTFPFMLQIFDRWTRATLPPGCRRSVFEQWGPSH